MGAQAGQGDVPVEAVLAALQRRIGEDAVTVAVLSAQVETLQVEVTRLRGLVPSDVSVGDAPSVQAGGQVP